MKLLTHSRMSAFRACPRKHEYAYVRRYKPVHTANALLFGTAIHEGLEGYWNARRVGSPDDVCVRASLAAVLHNTMQLDPFDEARLRTMLMGYACAWSTKDVQVLEVEREFTLPLRNPDTGIASSHWQLAGKIDLIIREKSGMVSIVEHKSTSDSAAPGTPYRQRLAIDGQVRQYIAGAQALGYDASSVVYDVLCKPRLRPKVAETPAEFEARILSDMTAEPAKYFQQVYLARDEDLEARYRRDVWKTAALMDDAEAGWSVHNPDACFRYASPCEYWGVCSGTASLEDARFYTRAEHAHAELSVGIQKGA